MRSSPLPSHCQAKELSSSPAPAENQVGFLPDLDSPINDEKPLTAEEKRTIYLNSYAANLKDEGMRSPAYYRGRSPFMSFDSPIPAVMGILKATRVRKSYIEAEDLIRRLRELESCNGYAPRYYDHPAMRWESYSEYQTPGVWKPDKSIWFWDKLSNISDLRRKLGHEATEHHRQLAIDHWDKVCDIQLAPVPDSHLLKHINHSASGTLFPRYLVKGLHTLRAHANLEAQISYGRREKEAEIKRQEVIREWTQAQPDSLAFDPCSIYTTWPSELMDKLDVLDQEAMQDGNAEYIAILQETEQKMQTLVAFYEDNHLITGERTPSPQWPFSTGWVWDSEPYYLTRKLDEIAEDLGVNNGAKQQIIEISRYKEAKRHGALESSKEGHTMIAPAALTAPLPQPVLDELDIVWQDYNFLYPEDTESAMIDVLSQWRKSKGYFRCNTEKSPPPQTSGISMANAVEPSPPLTPDIFMENREEVPLSLASATFMANTGESSPPQIPEISMANTEEAPPTLTPESFMANTEEFSPPQTPEISMTNAEEVSATVDRFSPKPSSQVKFSGSTLSRSDAIAHSEGLGFLQAKSRRQQSRHCHQMEPSRGNSTWRERLRSKPVSHIAAGTRTRLAAEPRGVQKISRKTWRKIERRASC